MGVTYMRCCQKLPLYLTEPVPESSKVNLPLSKPISNGDSTSGVMYLTRGKALLDSSNCSQREEGEILHELVSQ